MINTTTLVGRITDTPKVEKTQSGHSVVKFTLAVNRLYKRDETDFIRIVAWRQTADFIGQYVDKGDLLGVVGRIETGSYEDKDGKRVYTTEVVADNVQALESKKEKAKRQGGQQQYEPELQEEFGGPTLDITSENLPF